MELHQGLVAGAVALNRAVRLVLAVTWTASKLALQWGAGVRGGLVLRELLLRASLCRELSVMLIECDPVLHAVAEVLEANSGVVSKGPLNFLLANGQSIRGHHQVDCSKSYRWRFAKHQRGDEQAKGDTLLHRLIRTHKKQ